MGLKNKLTALMFMGLCAVTAQSPPSAIVGVKLMKAGPGRSTGGFQVHLPADCGQCEILSGAIYRGENGREAFFYLRVPADSGFVRKISVETGGVAVRSVIVEKNRIPFSINDGSVMFDVPIVPRTRSSTMEVQTTLEWPGIALRIEHAFEDRRAGKYATGAWPSVQTGSALNLEFGLREALRALKLDREVVEKGLGKIHLMGFDTNNPLGHEDFPPHIHLILRWPRFAGSQAPHYYLSDRGLLLPDVVVTIDGMPHITSTRVPEGRFLPAVDYTGGILYETLIRQDGGMTIRRPGGDSCELDPLSPGPRGFASGVIVRCSSGGPIRLRASDDTGKGEVLVSIDSREPELYRYDVDTAVLVKPVTK
jgi:hypothetical protein